MRAGVGLRSLPLILCTFIRLVSGSSNLSQEQYGSGLSLRTLLTESDHKYEMHHQIRLFANKVGPFSNPR